MPSPWSVMLSGLCLIAVGAVHAAEPREHAPTPTRSATATAAADRPLLHLSPKLRAALVAEMVGLKQGAGELAALLATGEWEAAAVRAERVRDSYIMKEKLSPPERAELVHALPADFVALDGRFHRHAGGLAQAARARDADLAVFHYTKMLEGCMSCHSRYATHTLSGFRATPAPAHAH